ncbi:hypothetical protein CRENBAI_008101 [Crenichthys baileyi]|uniref:Uncharacterized protein n=1 Tax=Crenichthys baileyi TaxID=28760 RepID=A0AAV9RUX4_9TELE
MNVSAEKNAPQTQGDPPSVMVVAAIVMGLPLERPKLVRQGAGNKKAEIQMAGRDSYRLLRPAPLSRRAHGSLMRSLLIHSALSRAVSVCVCVSVYVTGCRQRQKQSVLLERRVGDDQRNALLARDPT